MASSPLCRPPGSTRLPPRHRCPGTAAPRFCVQVRASPPTLTPTTTALNQAETAARAAFLAGTAGAVSADAAAVSLLRQVGATRDADADAVLGALAHALTSGTPLPGACPATPAALAGRPWRLVFSAPAPIAAWRYIPVPEFFALPPAGGGGAGSEGGRAPAGPVCLSSDVGPLHFAFSGSGRFVGGGAGEAGGDAALEFAFTRADVQWGRDAPGPFFTRELGRERCRGGGQPALKAPKTYTFFAYLPPVEGGGAGGVEVVGARSSGGALSLLARR